MAKPPSPPSPSALRLTFVSCLLGLFFVLTPPPGIADRGLIPLRELLSISAGFLLFGLYFDAIVSRWRSSRLEQGAAMLLLLWTLLSVYNSPLAMWTLHHLLAFYICPYLIYLGLRVHFELHGFERAEGVIGGLAVANALLMVTEHFFRSCTAPLLVHLQGAAFADNAANGAATGIFNGRTEAGAFYATLAAYSLVRAFQCASPRGLSLAVSLALCVATVLSASRNALLALAIALHLAPFFAWQAARQGAADGRLAGFSGRRAMALYIVALAVILCSIAIAPRQRSGYLQMFAAVAGLFGSQETPLSRGHSSSPASPGQLAPPPRVSIAQGNTAALRLAVYQETVQYIRQRPWLGYGLRGLQVRLKAAGPNTIQAHNIWLHLLAEVGLIGFLPFLLLLGLAFGALWKAGAIWRPAAAALLVFFGLMQFDYYLGHTSCLNLLFVCLAAAAPTAVSRRSLAG